MATVNKDFKIKSGLVVEGTTATVNGYDILTKKQDDQNYVVNLIGGTATSANEADKVVKRDGSGNFAAGTITADLVGDVTGTVSDISNHNTDSLSEGSNNLYYTDTRARGAFSEGLGIDIVNGEISVNTHGAIGDSSVSGLEVYPGTGPNAISFVGIDRFVVDTWYDAAGAAANAQSAAEATASADATSKANAAKAYTDTREAAITTAYQSYADTAESDAKAYADQKVADLVDSAPALLDTLNELAAAIGDDANFAANLATSVGEKVAKAGDTMTGALVLHADPVNNLEAATKAYVDTAASTAQSNAEDYADGLAGNYDPAGSASAAQTAAEGYASGLDSATNTRIDNLDTDDVAEGSSQYFTDARAKDSAAALLTTATLTNITITGTGNGGLTITAENGVADSDTDDLTEGTTNLYFTEQRALDAVSGSNIQPESVDITWVRREEATWTNVPTASTATVHSFATNKGSAKYLVRVISGSFSHVTEILATTDASNNVAVVEYGTIYTSENPLATATVVWDGQSAYNLNVTTANNNSEVLVAATLLAYND
jgi:hypothetical protein